jgi:glutamate-1-semialdehyde aminotransferase
MAVLVEGDEVAVKARYDAERDCLKHVEYLLTEKGLRALLIELVCANSGMVLSGVWLAELQRLLTRHGALLIVDEIMTAGRVPGDVIVSLPCGVVWWGMV